MTMIRKALPIHTYRINVTQKGFTLIELLVVVKIIGVLAAIGVVAFNGFIHNSKINTVKANRKSVVKYIQTELHEM